MQSRKLLLGFTLLALFLAAPALAQESPSSEEIQAEIQKLSTVNAAIEADDLPAATEAMGTAITADNVDQWKAAIKERLAILGELDRLPRLLGEVPDSKQLSELEREVLIREGRLKEEIRRKGEDFVPPKVSKRELETLRSKLESLTTRRKERERRLAELDEEAAKARQELPAFRAKLETLREKLVKPPPDASDTLGIFQRDTDQLDQGYRQRWVTYAELLEGRMEKIRASFGQDIDLTTRLEERQKGIVERATEKLRKSHIAQALELEQQASIEAGKAEAIKVEGLPSDDPERLKKAEYEREKMIFLLRAGVERDIAEQQVQEKTLDDAERKNEEFQESRDWIKKRFHSSGGVSSRTAPLLIKAHERVRDARRHLDRTLKPEREALHDKYLTFQAEVDDQLRDLREAKGEDRLKAALKKREESVDGMLAVLIQLDKVYAEREALADEIYPEILKLIYWVHSDDPLGTGTITKLEEELPPAATLLFGPGTRKIAQQALDEGGNSFLVAASGMLILFVLGLILPESSAVGP